MAKRATKPEKKPIYNILVGVVMYTKEIAWSLRKRAEMTCKRFMITYKHIAIKNNLNKKEAFIIDFISL